MQSTPRIDELRQKFHENPRRYFAPLANEYRRAGDPEQAIAICRAHLAQQPAHMSGHVVYGQALYDAHRTDEAREVFQLALALDPENVIVLRHLGDIARQRGDVQEARSWYSRALDSDPHDAEIAAYLAELTEPLVSHGAEPEPEVEAPLETAAEPEESPYLDTEEDTKAQPEEQPGEQPASAPEETVPETPSQPVERQSRLTPTGEGFPILTRTLAELYLQQGHIEAALDIYRQLAEHEPEDADIRARIAALSFEESYGAKPEPQPEPESEPEPEPEPEHVLAGTPVDETVLDEELKEAADLTGGDDLEIAEVPGSGEELAMEFEEPPIVAADAAPVEGESLETPGSDRLWDTADFWGGGFFEDTEAEDEIFGLSDDALSVASKMEEPETPIESDAEVVEFISANLAAAAYFENPEFDESPYALSDIDVSVELEEEAYSGTPEVETRQVTVREFFATLGSMRPPFANQYEETRTVSEAEPAVRQSSAEEPTAVEEPYGFADDAFANLFADAPANADDSRAATALSSAMAHGAPFSTSSTPSGSHRASPSPPREASTQPGQESDEDIRRFREWLDGLAES